MERSSGMVFPSMGMHILSALIHLLGVSVLSHIISRRLISSDGSLRHASWPRIAILIVFVDSWLFLFTAGVLILGAGMEHSSATCSLGIYLCIVFYASSKVFIYCFLIERVYVVWRPAGTSSRFKSKVYLLCLATLAGYLVIMVLLFVGQLSRMTEAGICKIGLKKIASIPLLTYDLFINALLTTLFVWPLFTSSIRNNRIQRLGVKTLCSALIALTTSCVNIVILTLMMGQQLGWVCLGSCGTDVVINAIALFWVTDNMSERSAASGPQLKLSHITPQYVDCTLPKDGEYSSVAPTTPVHVASGNIKETQDNDDLESSQISCKPSQKGFKRFFRRNSSSDSEEDITSVQVQIRVDQDIHQEEQIYEMPRLQN